MRRLGSGCAVLIAAGVLTACGTSTAPSTAPSTSSSPTPQSTVTPSQAVPAAPGSLAFRIVAMCGAGPCIAPAAKPDAPDLPRSDAPSDVVAPEAALAWAASPSDDWTRRFASQSCDADKANIASSPVIACDDQGKKYLLSSPVLTSVNLSGAVARKDLGWTVNLNFNSSGTKVFETLSRQMVAGATYGGMQFAIVYNGRVLSAVGFSDVVTGGQAQITAQFTESQATDLAEQLNRH